MMIEMMKGSRDSAVVMDRVLWALALVLLAYGLAKATWLLWPASSPSLPAVVLLHEPTSDDAQPSLMALPTLTAWGQASDKPVDAQPKKAVPESKLNAKLTGIILVPGRSVVLMHYQGKDLVLKEGEAIDRQASVKEIYATYIVITHRGKDEKLVLKEVDESIQTVARSSSSPTVSGGYVLGDERLLASPQAQEIKRTLKKQPLRIAEFLRFQPLQNNGQWSSIQIWPKKHHDIFAALGFQDGDKLVGVAGQSVADLMKKPMAWKQFLREDRVQLEIEREGLRQTITLDLTE